MNTYFQIVVLSAISLASLNLQAEEQQDKKYLIGLGIYGLELNVGDSAIDKDHFSGLALNAAYAFTDNVAVKGAYYSLKGDDFSELEVKGLDLVIVAGTGLATPGFKVYGGGGFFNETWKLSGFSGDEKFSGLQLVWGTGYNWAVVSLDLSMAIIRISDDYDELISKLSSEADASAAAGTLTIYLSARF